MDTETAVQEEQEEQFVGSGKWRNLYRCTTTSKIKHGDFLWGSKEVAEYAALHRGHPELFEYLGAFELEEN